MKHYLFILIIGLFVSLMACDDEQVTVEESNEVCYPLVVKKNGAVQYEFLYNEDTMLPITIKYYNEGNLIYRGEVEYNDAGQKVSLQYYDASDNVGDYVTYSYNEANLLSRADFFTKDQAGGFSVTRYISYAYNSKRQLIKKYHYKKVETSEDGQTTSSLQLDFYYTYTYNSANNVILKKYYDEEAGNPNSEIIELEVYNYEYDKKSNLYTQVPFFYDFDNLSANNIKKATGQDIYGRILDNTYSSSFTYNEAGYPVQEDRKYIGATETETYEIQYQCVKQTVEE